MRISNYLLWQIAYTELWISKTLWPDFTANELLEAISEFQSRKRRKPEILFKILLLPFPALERQKKAEAEKPEKPEKPEARIPASRSQKSQKEKGQLRAVS